MNQKEIKEAISKHMAEIGRKGGLAKTKKKSAASRETVKKAIAARTKKK
jgi:hypothetical protein